MKHSCWLEIGWLRPLRRSLAIALWVCLLTAAFLSPALAGDGALDPSFDPGVGANHVPIVFSQILYNDFSGKSMITGSFTEVGGHPTRGLARLNADVTTDTSFTSPLISGWVNSCYLLSPGDPNSQMLIAGPFEVPSNSGAYYGLARLNADGTVDSSFTHTFGPCPGMSGIGVQSDGKIVVGGTSLAVNGYPGTTFYLLRLDANGNVDPTFTMRSAPGALVRMVQAYPSGDSTYPNYLRIFGVFPRWSDPTHTNYMVLVNASGSVMQTIGDEIIDGPILSYWLQGDNKMVIVGDFNTVYGTSMNGVARLLPAGGLDPDFNQVGAGANRFVQKVVVDTGNKPVLAGYFTSFNGTPCGYYVRLNYNGSVDATWNPGGVGADDRVWNILKNWSTGTWMIFGAFQNINGQPRPCGAALAADGAPLSGSTTLAHTGTATVYTVQDSYQGLYLGGDFSGYGGKYGSRQGRAYFDGSVDLSFRAQMNGVVKSIRTQPDGKILVAGTFDTVYGYNPRTGLARFNADGSLDRAFKPIIAKADGSTPDLGFADVDWNTGKIMIGGDFASVNGLPRSSIARLNGDGSLDTTFNFNPASMPGLSNIVVNGAGADDPTGPIPMAGKAVYNGSPCGFGARLLNNGALDTTFATGPSPVPNVVVFNGNARTGAFIEATGQILLAGDFTQVIDGVTNPTHNYIARFSPDGILDPTFNPTGPNGPIYELQQQRPNAKYFIGGSFTTYNGVGRNNIARINADGVLDTSFDPGAGANGAVYTLDWNSYMRRLMIGGAFTTYNGVSRIRVARLLAGGSYNPAIPLLLLLDSTIAP